MRRGVRRAPRGGLLVMLLVSALAFGAGQASASVIGNTEGCSPGYWKNHPGSWQEMTTTQSIASLYGAAGTPYDNLTLLQGLSLRGGPGVSGAQQILLRAAIAAALNAAYDSPDGEHLKFPWRREGTGFDGEPPLIPTVYDALRSGNRDTILKLASWLDADNNLGCPLS